MIGFVLDSFIKNSPYGPRPMINGKDWNFKILLDENHNLKRALNIVGIPHTIITKDTKIIYRRIGYSPTSH